MDVYCGTENNFQYTQDIEIVIVITIIIFLLLLPCFCILFVFRFASIVYTSKSALWLLSLKVNKYEINCINIPFHVVFVCLELDISQKTGRSLRTFESTLLMWIATIDSRTSGRMEKIG
jgi:hypothetical protein